MAEDLQKPLLEKLHAIEEAVNNLGKSFEKLEGRIHTLEDAYAITKRDVEDLKESLNANETNKKTTTERIQKLEDDIKFENGKQTTKCTRIFPLRSSNVGEHRWKPSNRQDATIFPQPSAKPSLINCT